MKQPPQPAAPAPTGVKQPAAPLPPEDPDPAVRWADRRFALVVRAGKMMHPFLPDTPPGLVGLRLSFSPIPYIGVEAGAGLVPGNLSALVFARVPVLHALAVTLGVGRIWTLGKYEQYDPGADHNIHVYNSPQWWTVGLGLETRSRGGWILRTDFELYSLVNAHKFNCRDVIVDRGDPQPATRPCADPARGGPALMDAADRAYWTEGVGIAIGVGHAF